MKTTIGVILMAAAAFGQDGRSEAATKLNTMKVTVDFHDVALAEAVDYLREVTGLNMLVSSKVTEKYADLKVTLKVRDLTVKSALKLMLHGRDLTATYRDGAVVILPQEDLQSAVEIRMYDVRAQMVKIQDFPGPKVELATPGSNNGRAVVDTVFTFQEPVQVIGPEFLVTLVKENTGGRSWEAGSASLELLNGRLVVSQTPAVHREIEHFLKLLEQYK